MTHADFPLPIVIAGYLGSTAFSVWLLLMLLKLGSIVRGKDANPPNGQLQQSVNALENRVSKIEAAQDAIRHEMREDTQSILKAGEERSAKLHERINPVIESLSFIKGQGEAFVTSFNNLATILVAQGKQKND